MYRANKGKIDQDFGYRAFTTPPLAAFPSCDAKFTTTDLAKRLSTVALFGPPLGRTWDPLPEESRKYPDIRPLGLSLSEKEALVAFLGSLTDPRVSYD